VSVHIKLDSCCCDQTFAFERLHLIQASTVRLLTLSSDMDLLAPRVPQESTRSTDRCDFYSYIQRPFRGSGRGPLELKKNLLCESRNKNGQQLIDRNNHLLHWLSHRLARVVKSKQVVTAAQSIWHISKGYNTIKNNLC
jgi:hypothetical protein